MKKNAFTILELLVTVALIGVIILILYIDINPKEKIEDAKIAVVIQEMLDIKNAVIFYVLDTGTFPVPCRLDCTELTDSFLTAPLGVSGWKGPYLKNGLWNRSHSWGGQIGLVYYDSNDNGNPEVWVVLDDDAPGTNWNDNSGAIPDDILERIDRQVDDGELGTGNMFLGDNMDSGGLFASGEGAWRVYRIGE